MRNVVIGLLALALLGCGASSAIADPEYTVINVEIGDRYKVTDNPPNIGAQGPFQMTWDNYNGAGIDDRNLEKDDFFYSFCTEVSEHFTPGQVYLIANVSKVSGETGRVLQDYGAWVYKAFALNQNGVRDWVTSPTNNTAANAIQDAIWWSMVGPDLGAPYDGQARELNLSEAGWKTSGSNNTLKTKGLSYQHFAEGLTDGNQFAYISDVSDVGVLNLVYASTGAIAQDQIGISDKVGGVVPEPASMLVWSLLGGAGLGLVGVRRRRRA